MRLRGRERGWEGEREREREKGRERQIERQKLKIFTLCEEGLTFTYVILVSLTAMEILRLRPGNALPRQ